MADQERHTFAWTDLLWLAFLGGLALMDPIDEIHKQEILLAIGLFLAGMTAYRILPVASVPRVDYPMVAVGASLPGADPSTVAASLAAPLERRLGQIAVGVQCLDRPAVVLVLSGGLEVHGSKG